VCDALPSSPGLLGLPITARTPRVLSPSALRVYQLCPTRYLLTRDIGLPREPVGDSPAQQRGLLVHAWLEAAHRRGPDVRCTPEGLPDPDDVGTELLAAMAAEEYRLIRPYLLRHLDHCLLGAEREIRAVIPEATVAVHDPDADVLAVTRPDLVAQSPAGPVWRETKTHELLPACDRLELLAAYPQLALAVCVLADRALQVDDHAGQQVASPADGPGWVELELLTPERGRLERFDAGDERDVPAARTAIAESAHAWHHDDVFRPRPAHSAATARSPAGVRPPRLAMAGR